MEVVLGSTSQLLIYLVRQGWGETPDFHCVEGATRGLVLELPFPRKYTVVIQVVYVNDPKQQHCF